MSVSSIDMLDFAALLCSRLCHDLISPVGAIVNGMEIMAEDADEETKRFALDLIRNSADKASAKLQFCRIAFGAAGGANAQIDLGDAGNIARNFFEDEKTRLDWRLPRKMLPKNHVKLLLNMLLIISQSIPRGGMLIAEPIGEGENLGFKVSAKGAGAKISSHASLLGSDAAPESLDAHSVQPFYTRLLAKTCGLTVSIATESDVVIVSVQ